MKSTLRCFTLAGLLVMPVSAGFAVAGLDDLQTEGGHRALMQQPQPDDAAASDDESREAGEGQARAKPRGPLSPSQLVEKLTELQAAMKEHLDLSSEQEHAIESLFDEHIEKVKGAMDRDKREPRKAPDLDAIRELRQQLIDARKAGDKERAKEIREQMSEKLQQRRSEFPEPVGRFIERIEGELEEEQVSTFRTLVKRFDLARARRPRSSLMGNLMRAAMSPEVGLSREQRRTIREAMREHMTSANRHEMDDEQQKESFKQLREKVMAELTAEQRATVEAKLEQFEKEGPGGRPDWRRPGSRTERSEEQPRSVEPKDD